MSSPLPTPSLQTLQATTALASLTVSSLNLSLTILAVPNILQLPAEQMLRQWKNLYTKGGILFPGPMLLCGLSYATLAYRLSSSSSLSSLSSSADSSPLTRVRLITAAAALCLSILPWSVLFMVRQYYDPLLALVEKIPSKAKATPSTSSSSASSSSSSLTQEEEKKAKELMRGWGLYNLGRGVPVFIAGAIGLFTLTW